MDNINKHGEVDTILDKVGTGKQGDKGIGRG